MHKPIAYQLAKQIMGRNFIGVEELNRIDKVKFFIPKAIPKIPFEKEELKKKSADYILILGICAFGDQKPVTIRNLRETFGKDPEMGEPCFYNQDWYDNEEFIDIPLSEGWYLIRRSVYEDSRAVQPQELEIKYAFPNAVSCVYAFFMAWLTLDIKLWYHDFVWCSDKDHNGDRIYVGKYHDIDGINKNGFNIHRHLGLRNCYGCID